jgi:predicted CXXCH cytochrome family protein
MFCHHYHTAAAPMLLLAPSPELCLRCHEASELTQGTHHENVEQADCTACHDAHGGSDPFFLLDGIER